MVRLLQGWYHSAAWYQCDGTRGDGDGEPSIGPNRSQLHVKERDVNEPRVKARRYVIIERPKVTGW